MTLVKFPGKSKPVNDAVKETADFAETARVIARLALMDAVGYERCRLAKAKEIGCRASFLDKMVRSIRDDARSWMAGRRGAVLCDDVEAKTLNHSDGASIPVWTLAKADGEKKWHYLFLYADGTLTVAGGFRDKD